jgi:hypothetical protein
MDVQCDLVNELESIIGKSIPDQLYSIEMETALIRDTYVQLPANELLTIVCSGTNYTAAAKQIALEELRRRPASEKEIADFKHGLCRGGKAASGTEGHNNSLLYPGRC